jgi:hypothetical protein
MAQTENTQSPSTNADTLYAGGCHCGAVRFEAELDLSKGASRCNCSICMKTGSTNAMARPGSFRLVKGAESLGEYRVGNSPNSRSFCKHCGIQCYGQGYVEEIGGAFCSININCLDDVDPSTLTIGYWDGRNNNWHAGLRSQPWPVRPQR